MSKKKKVCRDIENLVATEARIELENLCRDRSPYVTTDHSNIDIARHGAYVATITSQAQQSYVVTLLSYVVTQFQKMHKNNVATKII